MANINMNDVREFKFIPIHHIRIGINGGGDYYYNLEEGSQWSLIPVLRPNDRGGNRIVAWKFEGTFVVLQNNYEDNLAGFTNIINYPVGDFDLWLAPGYATTTNEWTEWSSDMNSGFFQISYDSGNSKVKQWHATFDLKQSKETPRATIQISGLFSSDMFDSGTIFSSNLY